MIKNDITTMNELTDVLKRFVDIYIDTLDKFKSSNIELHDDMIDTYEIMDSDIFDKHMTKEFINSLNILTSSKYIDDEKIKLLLNIRSEILRDIYNNIKDGEYEGALGTLINILDQTPHDIYIEIKRNTMK